MKTLRDLTVDYVLFTHYCPKMGYLEIIQKVLKSKIELVLGPEEQKNILEDLLKVVLDNLGKIELELLKDSPHIKSTQKLKKALEDILERDESIDSVESTLSGFQNIADKLYHSLSKKQNPNDEDTRILKAVQNLLEPTVLCDIAFLRSYKNVLEDLLEKRHKKGVLIIFYDPGWLELQNTVGLDFNPKKFAEDLSKALKFQETIHKEFKNLLDRIRIVTANDLCPIINNLRGDRPGLEATKLRRFLGERAKGMRYDTSKVVEAIIRLRNLGSGTPVFRIDWDALFNPDSKNSCPLSIHVAIDNHKDILKDSRIHSFLFSGGYKYPGQKPDQWKTDDWIKAFATRVFPVLKVTDNLKKAGKDKTLSENDIKDALDSNIALKFYGIKQKPDKTMHEFEEDVQFVNGIPTPEVGTTSYGSNPIKAVISGALLCLSDSAILDLPPYSNFRLNVMWIDDHLKYALHRELGHFLEEKNLTIKSRVNTCTVTKDRAPIKNICHYVMGTYLPTLLWGAIMDAWIQPNPCLNYDFLDQSLKRPEPGILPRTLNKALERGYIQECSQPTDRARLVEEFRNAAYKRIKHVQTCWKQLKSNGQHTFASLWVSEDPATIIRIISTGNNVVNGHQQNENWIGFGLTNDGNDVDEIYGKNLRKCIMDELEKLIDDAINYIEWTLEWPRFVQSVRSVRQGKLPMDLSWRPTNI